MKQKQEESKVVKRINKAVKLFKKISKIKNSINKRMEGKYSSSLIALVATIAAFFLMVMILFIPNYLGVADDGSISRIMTSAGIYYVQTEISDIYNNYFVKNYSLVLSGYHTRDPYFNSQLLFLKAAIYFDNLITRNKFFDIRFLALIYSVFYIPAIYFIIKQACMRVNEFSEGFVIGIAGVVVFTDVAYITYFNSFYPEAVWFVSFMYCIGAALSFQEKRSGYQDFRALLVILSAGTILATSRSHTAIIAIILAVFCLKLLFLRNNWVWGSLCVMSAFFFSFMGILCMTDLKSDFDTTSKFHAMTRGILLESGNPGETLSEFGIDASYEMLADVSSYDYLPLVKATDEILRQDFLEQFTQFDIAAYYARHPAALFGMLDASIKSCFNIRREYCGNYEQSVGLPKRAKSFFWGAWSNFKSNTLPKTIGYFLFLIGVVIFLFKKDYAIRPYEERRSTVFLDTMMLIVFISLAVAIITIVNCGDAEMVRYCFLTSNGIDFMHYFIFVEVVHRIKIF